jgi:hypothetical protein
MAQPYYDELVSLANDLELAGMTTATLRVEHFFNAAILRANGKTCASLTADGIAFNVGQSSSDQYIANGEAGSFRYYQAGTRKQGYALFKIGRAKQDWRELFVEAIENVSAA